MLLAAGGKKKIKPAERDRFLWFRVWLQKEGRECAIGKGGEDCANAGGNLSCCVSLGRGQGRAAGGTSRERGGKKSELGAAAAPLEKIGLGHF